jgi:hypothetical protein
LFDAKEHSRNGKMTSKKNGDSPNARPLAAGEKPVCFIIMPISDPEGYEPGHFQHVFEDLFVPACEKAGYQALRADQVRETNLIHLDVLQRILDSPMVLCDLSSRNPNVLFELGLRQAFDKPVALVQEVGTPQIFDITPLRFTNYRRELIYREALQDQDAIAAGVIATKEATSDRNSVNSIVKLLSITHPASRTSITESDRDSAILQVIMTELANLRSEIRSVGSPTNRRYGLKRIGQDTPVDLAALRDEFEHLQFNVDNLINGGIPPTDFTDELERLDLKLKVLMTMKGDSSTRDGEIALSLRNRLWQLRHLHDSYVRSAKTELES